MLVADCCVYNLIKVIKKSLFKQLERRPIRKKLKMAAAMIIKDAVLNTETKQTILCTPCSRDHKDIQGFTYCPECQEYFCETCTNIHKTFPILKDHQTEQCSEEPLNLVTTKSANDDTEPNNSLNYEDPLAVNKSQTLSKPDHKLATFEAKFRLKLKQSQNCQQQQSSDGEQGQGDGCSNNQSEQRYGDSQSQQRYGDSQSTQRYGDTQCALHGGENLTVYCKDHDGVGCHVCAAISHRQCKTVIFLPEASQGFSSSTAKKSYIDDITNTLKNLQNIKTARTKDMQTLQQNSDKIVETIEQYTDRVVKKIEAIAQESIKAVFTQTEALKETIQDDIKQSEGMFESIKHLQTVFSATDEGSDVIGFIQAKKGKSALEKGKTFAKVTSEHIGKEKVQYTIGTSLESYLDQIKVFGSIKFESISQVLNSVRRIRLKKTSFNNDIERDMANRALSIRDYCEISTHHSAHILVKQLNDILILEDTSTSKIKLFEPLSGRAFAMCCTGPLEMAVTVNQTVNQKQTGEVQFFALRTGIKAFFFLSPMKKVIKFKHAVFGIAYHQDNLFIGDGSKVFVCDMDGRVLYKLYEQLLGMPKHIAVSHDGNLVYIADFLAGLIILTRSGQIKKILKDKYLDGCHGVSVDSDRNVYTTGYLSSTLVQFDNQGNRKGVVVTKSSSCAYPVQVYHSMYGSLVLSPGILS